jgi:pimeloyl-ACP methyl ester carboxylesterase
MIPQLREQKAPAIADFGIIIAELVAVIAQRQWWIEIFWQRLEAAKMVGPVLIIQTIQPDTLVPAVISEAQNMFGKIGSGDGITDLFSQSGDLDIGSIDGLAGFGLRFIWHFLTVAFNRLRSKWEDEANRSMSEEKSYQDVYWESDDGLKLHAYDYPSESDKIPVICIPGLTRNARDFDHLGAALKGDRRIIMLDLRGRGMSEYAKDSSTYNPRQYVSDIIMLMDELKIARAVFFGTSLGGIVTMIMAKMYPARVAGALLNDIGPELDQKGLDRIADHVGQGRSFDTWAHAGRDIAENSSDIFPDFTLKDWIAFAKKVYRMNSSGRIKLDYDMKIADPFDSKGGGSGALWNALDYMQDIPTLILRGELSDLFSERVARQMLEKLDKGELVTVPRVGHCPTLEEPASLDAINELLHRID